MQSIPINDNNSFAIKLSALCNTKALIKANNTQTLIDSIFNLDSENNNTLIKLETLYRNLKKAQIDFTDEEFASFVEIIKIPHLDSKIRGKPNNSDMLSIVEWRLNFTCINLISPELNQHPIFEKIANYTKDEKLFLSNLQKRLRIILETAKERNVSLL